MFVQLKKSKQANKQIMKHPLNLMHSSYIYEGFQASLPGENNDYFYVSCDSHWVQYTYTPFISWHGYENGKTYHTITSKMSLYGLHCEHKHKLIIFGILN